MTSKDGTVSEKLREMTFVLLFIVGRLRVKDLQWLTDTPKSEGLLPFSSRSSNTLLGPGLPACLLVGFPQVLRCSPWHPAPASRVAGWTTGHSAAVFSGAPSGSRLLGRERLPSPVRRLCLLTYRGCVRAAPGPPWSTGKHPCAGIH